MIYSDLCPQWYKLIESLRNGAQIDKQIKREKWTAVRRPSKCVLGEAYDSAEYALPDVFPADYLHRDVQYCSQCTKFSTEFSLVLSSAFYVHEDNKWKVDLLSEFKKKKATDASTALEADISKWNKMAGKIDFAAYDDLVKRFMEHWNSTHGVMERN